jgi:hypothetical protein
MHVTQLAHGTVNGADRLSIEEITVILIEPDDGTAPLVRVHWPLRPTTAAATHYPAVAAAIVRIIAESATALARHKAGRA